MATRPDTEHNEPLQPGRTEPEPTHFPDPMKQGEIPGYNPDPLEPSQPL